MEDSEGNYLADLGDHLQCHICLSTLVDPHSLPCNHLFCRECISRSITQKAQCPVCRIPCFKRDIKKNHQLSAIVSSFDKLVTLQNKRKREPEDDEGREESFFKRPKRSHDTKSPKKSELNGDIPNNPPSSTEMQSLLKQLKAHDEHLSEIDKLLAQTLTPLDGSPVKSLPNGGKNSGLNSQDSINGSERKKVVSQLSFEGQQESEQFGNDSMPQASNHSAIDTPTRKSPRRPGGGKKTPPKSKKKESSSSVDSDEEKENDESSSNKAKSPRAVSSKSTSSKFVLLPTSLNDEALTELKEVSKQLGGSVVKHFNAKVTHIVTDFVALPAASIKRSASGLSNSTNNSLMLAQQNVDKNKVLKAAKRTVKFLMGILQGKWLITMDWIKQCRKEGQWVSEESFEIECDTLGNVGGPQRGRISIGQKSASLFNNYSAILLGDFRGPTKPEFRQVLEAGGAEILNRLTKNDTDREGFITLAILDAQLTKDKVEKVTKSIDEDVEVIKSSWVLDCVSCYEILPFANYRFEE
jgi:hypothetical protein